MNKTSSKIYNKLLSIYYKKVIPDIPIFESKIARKIE